MDTPAGRATMVYLGLVAGGLVIYGNSWLMAYRVTDSTHFRYMNVVAQQWYAAAILLVAFGAWWWMARQRPRPSAAVGVLHALHVLGFIATVFLRA